MVVVKFSQQAYPIGSFLMISPFDMTETSLELNFLKNRNGSNVLLEDAEDYF